MLERGAEEERRRKERGEQEKKGKDVQNYQDSILGKRCILGQALQPYMKL